MDSSHDAPHVLIVTGMSGAGRSSAADVLEDMEYVVIDNLPPALLGAVVKEHDIPEKHTHLAVVIDSRSGLPIEEIREGLNALGRDNIHTRIVFLDADGHVAEGYSPAFNALNIFRVPAAHAVTQVTTFADADRLSITGWVRSRRPEA